MTNITNNESQIIITSSQQTPEKSSLPMISTISGSLFGVGCLSYSISTLTNFTHLVARKLLSIHPKEHQKIILNYLWNSSTNNALTALGLFTLSSAAFCSPAIFKKIEQIQNQNFGHSDESEAPKELDVQPQISKFVNNYAKNLFSISLGLTFIDQFATGARGVYRTTKSYIYSDYNSSYTSETKINLLSTSLILAVASTPFLVNQAKKYLNKQEK